MPQALIQVENFVKRLGKTHPYGVEKARLRRARASLPARTR
jgi:hypothetical protein